MRVAKEKYDLIRNIFIQNSLTRTVLARKVPSIDNSFAGIGELEYLSWRYVFMKDVTKTHMTKKLLKLGFDNLGAVEILNALNTTRILVKDILRDYKNK